MEHHRRCEACNKRASTCQAKHAYLKRKSTSNSINTKPSKSTDTASSNYSFTDGSATEAGTTGESEPQAELYTCPITTMASLSEEDLSTRLDAASTAASAAIAQAQIQLAAPIVETSEYTDDEESTQATTFSEDYEKTDLAIADMSKRVDDILREVLIDIESQKSKARSNDQSATEPPQLNPLPMEAIATAHEEPSMPQNSPKPKKATESDATTQIDNQQRLGRRLASVSHPVPIYEPELPPLGPPKASKTDSPFFAAGAPRKAKRPSKSDGWQTLWSWNYNAEW